MKIAVVSDYTKDEFLGGTELILDRLVKLWKDQGENIDFFVAPKHLNKSEVELTEEQRLKIGDDLEKEQFTMVDEILKSDFIVLVNIGLWSKGPIDKIIDSKKPYCKFEMDYGFDPERNGTIFNRIMANVGPNGEHSKEFEQAANPWYAKLIDNAKFQVYLNPEQREWYKRVFGDICNNSVLYFPFSGDLDKYKPMNLKRIKNSVIWVGRMTPEKGIDRAISYAISNQDKTVFFCGGGPLENIPKIVKNCVSLGVIDKDTLPYLYNVMETFIYFPNWLDTGPMTLAEAFLCGCDIVSTPQALITSWHWKDGEEGRSEMVKYIKEGPTRLLDRIKREIEWQTTQVSE